jgi:hypothetical protein
MHTLTHLSMQRAGSWRGANATAATRAQNPPATFLRIAMRTAGYQNAKDLRRFTSGALAGLHKPNFQASPLDLCALRLLWCGENAMRVAQLSGSETAGRASAPGERTVSDLVLTMNGTMLAEPTGYASA